MPFVMRSVTIWGGGMLGLVGGFLVGRLLSPVFVTSDSGRVTSETAVTVLLALTVPLILGTVLGAYLAARLTRPRRAAHVGSPSERGCADARPSGRGDAFGDWTGMALLLGGVAVDDEAVWELAGLVEAPLRQKLESALRFRSNVVEMTSDDRTAILRAIEDAPDNLRGVRELFLTHERWRQSLTDLQQDRPASSSLPPRDEWPAARSVA
jgi:hypothetical protein